MTRSEFEEQMQRLGVLRQPPDDVEEFWNALNRHGYNEFRLGVDLALKTRSFFPVPAELRGDILAATPRPSGVGPDRSKPLKAPTVVTLPTGREIPITRIWHYQCELCSDSGWRNYWCEGGGSGEGVPKPWLTTRPCGRFHTPDIAAHEWAGPCDCISATAARAR